MSTTSILRRPTRQPRGLRVLSLDGGGVKGYSSLLILKRIFRTMTSDNGIGGAQPLPCDVFDLIVGTSTGGLIAIMLGRLHMSIDDCLKQYETTSAAVFGHPVSQSKLGKVFKKVSSGSFYDLAVLEREIRRLLQEQGKEPDEKFQEENPRCKVMVSVTRTITSKADVIRNYTSHHPTQENYDCSIWEAACATAAAPMFFQSVKLGTGGEEWCDGAMRRNNPINEAIDEVSREGERAWQGRPVGCVISIGTGVVDTVSVSNSTGDFLKSVIKIMTDSEDVADAFLRSVLGQRLHRNRQYFRFNVPQGMQTVRLDEWKEVEKMKAVTTEYLSKHDVGDAVKSCAQSLFDPDRASTSARLSRKRPTGMADGPCLGFVDRSAYSSALLAFFWDYDDTASQSFVLWGTGGVGKTQLALRLAEAMKSRMSVIWIRADQSTNFYHDYSNVMRQQRSGNVSGKISESKGFAENLEHHLGETKSFLEDSAAKWLLVLDNADDVDDFRNSMDCYIPRKGRILITTRDPRFQGQFTAADNGLNVLPMDDEESVQLLAKSVPARLQGNHPDAALQELVGLLGNLPLGIAQAAANIVDQQISLSEYLVSYQNASDRLGALLEAPMRNRQTQDPRNATQSVNITWEMSFERLESSSPLSVTLMGYLSCFHWESIPRHLIRGLPLLSDLNDVEFRKVLSRPIHLSLLQEHDSEEFPRLRMHPLVHEYSWKRIADAAKDSEFLQPCVQFLAGVFPASSGEEDDGWQVCSLLTPHALRMMHLSESRRLVSPSLVSLMQLLARYLNAFGSLSMACNTAEKALGRARRIWPDDYLVQHRLRQTLIDCLRNNRRFVEALEEQETAIRYLQTDDAKATMPRHGAEVYTSLETKYFLLLDLGRHEESYETTVEILNLVTARRADVVSERREQELVVTWKHNGAFALARAGQSDAALRVAEEVLMNAKDASGALNVPKRSYLAFLNLKGQLLRDLPSANVGDISEALRIFGEVYDESMRTWGIRDKDTWVALNEVLDTLSLRYDGDVVGPGGESALEKAGALMVAALEACLASRAKQMRSPDSGPFRRAIEIFLGHVDNFLSHYEDQGQSLDYRIQQMVGTMTESFLLQGDMVIRDIASANAFGVKLQASGRAQEAEIYHRKALKGLLEWYATPNRPGLQALQTEAQIQETMSVYHYNIMLAIARQGRLHDAWEYRRQQEKGVLDFAETTYGSLDVRMERDRNDKRVYDEAQAKMDNGEGPLHGGEWWVQHAAELARAEKRYGKL
ncbi:hypothetical protein QBC34DRAFT_476804, partial [Podospora aff. communis PSN243]